MRIRRQSSDVSEEGRSGREPSIGQAYLSGPTGRASRQPDSLNHGTHANHTTTLARAAEESLVKTEDTPHPVHDDLLEFGTRGRAVPLSSVRSMCAGRSQSSAAKIVGPWGATTSWRKPLRRSRPPGLPAKTHIKPRISNAGRVHITKNTLESHNAGKVTKEFTVLPVRDSGHDEGLKVCCDLVEWLALFWC